MNGYQLILRDPSQPEPTQVWRGQRGQEMTASQATELLLHIAAAAPELHDGPAYLAVVTVPTGNAVVPAVVPPAAPTGSIARRRVFGWRLTERRVRTAQLLRAATVDDRGRALNRHRVVQLVRAEYRARGSQLAHPNAWSYLSIEPIGAPA